MVSIARPDIATDAATALAAWSARARVHTVPDVAKSVSADEVEYRKRLGRAIVMLRNAAGLSQATLAERVEVLAAWSWFRPISRVVIVGAWLVTFPLFALWAQASPLPAIVIALAVGCVVLLRTLPERGTR